MNELNNSWSDNWELPRWKRAINWLARLVGRKNVFPVGAKTINREIIEKMMDDEHATVIGFSGTHARAWDDRQFKDSWGKGDFSGLRQRWAHQDDRE